MYMQSAHSLRNSAAWPKRNRSLFNANWIGSYDELVYVSDGREPWRFLAPAPISLVLGLPFQEVPARENFALVTAQKTWSKNLSAPVLSFLSESYVNGLKYSKFSSEKIVSLSTVPYIIKLLKVIKEASIFVILSFFNCCRFGSEKNLASLLLPFLL